ncbi:4-(cytidine 5'-diphospho)-2-C-methyl-D-erythritol kinase [Paenarthrobacter sp. PH39-S1]|uniref:4-(cytidine 5'-diphospho)-2-C-methyl-D-erythritol kinase n=1 Tax=Paenarthrobacter sp. PH39-S1 TaxID=3046204 RepID=UPI0024B99D6A|nr:4-(cytidine 5'-diphospho)-2-C-methyl-D-erythritol kinase [Paenarthrobacter sp. PH39-S1]MDJ0356138.1 4-(cytidine 5'-diphospho)-2-C-methyl-D-erythritol kinase [Paenarthrobacter sp. PH39-S1]
MSSVHRFPVGRTVRVRAPGKINVFFRAGPLRPDGYHSVASLYLAVSLYEEVAATSVPAKLMRAADSASTGSTTGRTTGSTTGRTGPAFTDGPTPGTIAGPDGPTSTTGPAADATAPAAVTVRLRGNPGQAEGALAVPLDERNLAVRAARLMSDVSEGAGPVLLEITKRVPVSGGMGGGSADAAATLLACEALWDSGLSREELSHLAAELGADVPFGLLGGAAVGLGVGDELTPALAPSQLHWVLVQANFGLPTPEVFRQLDRMREDDDAEPSVPGQVDPAVLAALRAGDARALAAVLVNDLQRAAVALAPQLADVIAAGKKHGALASLVSGSGPTIAMLAADEADARVLADRLANDGHNALPVHGPVHGAKIISDVIR